MLLVLLNAVIEPYAVPEFVEYLQIAVSSVVSERVVTVVPAESDDDGEPPVRMGAVLSTITVTPVDVALLLELSRATATRVWEPSAIAVVSHDTP